MHPGTPPAAEGPLDPLAGLPARVAALAATGPDEGLAVQRALALIAEVAEWPMGQAFVLDGDGDLVPWVSWHTVGSRGAAFERATAALLSARTAGLPGRVISTGRPSRVADVAADPGFLRARAAADAGLRQAFAFPVTVDGDVIAVIEFLDDRTVGPSSELLEAIAQACEGLGEMFAHRRAAVMPTGVTTRLRRILDFAGDAFVGMDQNGVVTEWNREAERLFGFSREDALHRTVSELIVPPEFRRAHEVGVDRFLATSESQVLGHRVETRGLRKDGSEIPIDLTRWVLRENGEPAFYAFIRDITARKQAEVDLAHDALTGLANRGTLMERLQAALSRMGRGACGPAVMFIDIDRFKRINDSYGHGTGDQALVTVAQRLRALARPSDVVARLAGDEFVLMVEEIPTARDAAVVARRVVDALAVPFGPPGRRINLSASVGVAVASAGSDADSLLSDADAAMYSAKQAGRGRFDICGEQLREQVTSRLRREDELTAAIDRHQFELHYQPVFAMADRSIVGVEALLRWRHPELGLLVPAEFIDVAEESGLIVPIGEWVVGRACRQLSAWQRDVGASGLQVALNLSAAELAEDTIVERIAATIAASNLQFTDVRLCLELAESSMMRDPSWAAGKLTRLHELGISLAIDKFGAGYSSLAYLRWFPVDVVKIDPTFVGGLSSSRTDRAIVKAVIGVADELGVSVIADGVETTEQLELLAELGCGYVQGYLLARPEPADAVTATLQRSRAARGDAPR